MITIKTITGIDEFYQLEHHSWSGALDTLKAIKEVGLEDELMQHLNDIMECIADEGGAVEDTKLNDYLWFDRDYIYEALGLNEDGEVVA